MSGFNVGAESRYEAEVDLMQYIEVFYNRSRRHSIDAGLQLADSAPARMDRQA